MMLCTPLAASASSPTSLIIAFSFHRWLSVSNWPWYCFPGPSSDAPSATSPCNHCPLHSETSNPCFPGRDHAVPSCETEPSILLGHWPACSFRVCPRSLCVPGNLCPSDSFSWHAIVALNLACSVLVSPFAEYFNRVHTFWKSHHWHGWEHPIQLRAYLWGFKAKFLPLGLDLCGEGES